MEQRKSGLFFRRSGSVCRRSGGFLRRSVLFLFRDFFRSDLFGGSLFRRGFLGGRFLRRSLFAGAFLGAAAVVSSSAEAALDSFAEAFFFEVDFLLRAIWDFNASLFRFK